MTLAEELARRWDTKQDAIDWYFKIAQQHLDWSLHDRAVRLTTLANHNEEWSWFYLMCIEEIKHG